MSDPNKLLTYDFKVVRETAVTVPFDTDPVTLSTLAMSKVAASTVPQVAEFDMAYDEEFDSYSDPPKFAYGWVELAEPGLTWEHKPIPNLGVHPSLIKVIKERRLRLLRRANFRGARSHTMLFVTWTNSHKTQSSQFAPAVHQAPAEWSRGLLQSVKDFQLGDMLGDPRTSIDPIADYDQDPHQSMLWGYQLDPTRYLLGKTEPGIGFLPVWATPDEAEAHPHG